MSKCELCVDTVCLLNLREIFGKLSYSEKIRIIEKGRPVPDLDKLTQKIGKITRYFNNNIYNKYDWLAGCIHTNKLYCFPCILFSTRINTLNETGYADLNNLPKALRKHDQAEAHIASCFQYKSFGKSTVDTGTQPLTQSVLDIDEDRHTDYNRNNLIQLIDIICFLGKQGFLDYADSPTLVNNGNFFELVHLISKYNSQLDENPVSNSTLNDLISSIVSVINNQIVTEIKNTEYVSVIVDETPDINGHKQLVFIVRYFNNSEVVDRFIKCIDVSDRNAVTLSSNLISILKMLDCVPKLVAHTYDGAAVLSSDIDGVQALVHQQCPKALYVWCSIHSLSSILSKIFECIPGTKIFFSTVKSIVNFFNTNKQSALNETTFKKQLDNATQNNCTSHSHTINAIYKEHQNLIQLLEFILENPENWDSDTLLQASYILISLNDFEFNFFLEIFLEVFEKVDTLYETIQTKTYDIVNCNNKIEWFELFMQNYRNKFEIKYSNVAKKYGHPKIKRNIADLNLYYQQVFIEIIDITLNECHYRYEYLKDLKFFEILSCERFSTFEAKFPELLLRDLCNNTGFEFNRLRNELHCFYKSRMFTNLGVYDIIQKLYNDNLNTVFPETLRLAKLIVTIPAYNSASEKSFCSLNRIQSYLRNTQGQQSLSDLCMISIEKELLTRLKRSATFYDDVIKQYMLKAENTDLLDK